MQGELKISVMCPACGNQTGVEEVEHTMESDITSSQEGRMIKIYKLHPEAHIHCPWCRRRLSIEIRKAEGGFAELQVSC